MVGTCGAAAASLREILGARDKQEEVKTSAAGGSLASGAPPAHSYVAHMPPPLDGPQWVWAGTGLPNKFRRGPLPNARWELIVAFPPQKGYLRWGWSEDAFMIRKLGSTCDCIICIERSYSLARSCPLHKCQDDPTAKTINQPNQHATKQLFLPFWHMLTCSSRWPGSYST
jgi:hypothetical protein